MDTLKIKAKIVENGLTQKDVAKALSIAEPTVSQKINNIRPTNLNEAKKLMDLLKISEEEFPKYFFTQ